MERVFEIAFEMRALNVIFTVLAALALYQIVLCILERYTFTQRKSLESKMQDSHLINNSEIWSEVGKLIVGEMCLKDLRNAENLRYVPKLHEDSDEFYPLKVIRDIHTDHQIHSLSKTQTKFFKEYIRKKSGHLSNRRKSREIGDVHVAQICEERILEEVVHPAEFHPCLRIFQSVYHSSQPSSVSDRGMSREVTIAAENIRVRRIDPHELLWCRLDAGNGNKPCLVRVIYETHVAQTISLTFNVASHPSPQNQSGQETGSFDLTVKNCALAYRFVDLELSKEGVIIDIHFRAVPEQKSQLPKIFKVLREHLYERVRLRPDSNSGETCVLLPSLFSRNKQIMKNLKIHQAEPSFV